MSRGGAGPVAVVGLFGVGFLVLLAAVGGGSPVRGASAAGGLLKARFGQFLTAAEMVRSSIAERLGVDNTPPPAAQENLERLVLRVLDPLRVRVGRAVNVTSGYRCFAVNQAIHGSATSQHMVGEAADIMVDGFTAEQLATVIVGLGVPFDQVIWYAPERGGHVHVSYTEARANRRQGLYAPAGGGYLAWQPRGSAVA